MNKYIDANGKEFVGAFMGEPDEGGLLFSLMSDYKNFTVYFQPEVWRDDKDRLFAVSKAEIRGYRIGHDMILEGVGPMVYDVPGGIFTAFATQLATYPDLAEREPVQLQRSFEDYIREMYYYVIATNVDYELKTKSLTQDTPSVEYKKRNAVHRLWLATKARVTRKVRKSFGEATR